MTPTTRKQLIDFIIQALRRIDDEKVINTYYFILEMR